MRSLMHVKCVALKGCPCAGADRKIVQGGVAVVRVLPSLQPGGQSCKLYRGTISRRKALVPPVCFYAFTGRACTECVVRV